MMGGPGLCQFPGRDALRLRAQVEGLKVPDPQAAS